MHLLYMYIQHYLLSVLLLCTHAVYWKSLSLSHMNNNIYTAVHDRYI